MSVLQTVSTGLRTANERVEWTFLASPKASPDEASPDGDGEDQDEGEDEEEDEEDEEDQEGEEDGQSKTSAMREG